MDIPILDSKNKLKIISLSYENKKNGNIYVQRENKFIIRNLEPNCLNYSCCCCCCSCSKILAKSLHPPQNLCMPLKIFTCVSLRYIKHCGGGIVIVVCGQICGYGKMCGKLCDTIVGEYKYLGGWRGGGRKEGKKKNACWIIEQGGQQPPQF